MHFKIHERKENEFKPGNFKEIWFELHEGSLFTIYK